MIRFQCEHRNVDGAARVIYIYDRELETSTFGKMICTSDHYTLKYEGDPTDIFKRIIPLTCKFTIMLRHPNYTTEEQEEIQTFFQELVESHEGRFYVRCLSGEGFDTVTEFVGKILSDIGTLTLNEWEEVDITAIDGLSQLKEVEYRPTGYDPTEEEFAIQTTSFKDHFIDILNRNDVVEYFNDAIGSFSNLLLSTAGHWTESASVAGDIFSQVRVRNVWFEKVGKTYRKYKSCYDVLDELLKGFVARIYFANGHFQVEQLSYLDNATIVKYGYKIDGTTMLSGPPDTKVDIDYIDNDNFQPLPDPVKKWLAPLKAVEFENSRSFTNYMNGMQISATKTGFGGSGTLNFGPVIATGNKLVAQFRMEIINSGVAPTWASTIIDEYRFKFKLKVGDYWAKVQTTEGYLNMYVAGQFQQEYFNGGVPILEWSLTEEEIEVRWQKTTFSTSLVDYQNQMTNFRQSIKNSDFILETFEIVDDGDLIWTIGEFLHYRQGSEVGGTPPALLQFRNSSRIIIASGYSDLYEIPDGIKRWEVNDIRNTEVYKTSLKYYDSPSQLSFEQLFVTVSGVDYPTVEWTDPDSEVTLPIEDLYINTILAMRQYPAETFKIDFIYLDDNRFSFDDRLIINGNAYIPIDMEAQTGNGVYSATFWRPFRDFNGLIEVDIDEPEPDSPFPMPDGGTDFAYPPNTAIGVKYWEEWTDVATNYVVAEYVLSELVPTTEYAINTKVQVYINGVKQRYNDGTLSMRQYKFDLDLNRLMIFKGSGNVAHVELIIYN